MLVGALPLQILAVPTRRAAVAAMLMIGAVLAGYVYFVSLYLQKAQGLDPVETGLALVPATVTVVLTSTLLTRRLLARLAIEYVLLVGLGCMAAGQLWLSQVSLGSSYGASVLPGLLFTSPGIGFALPTASIAITSGVQGGTGPPEGGPSRPRAGPSSRDPAPQVLIGSGRDDGNGGKVRPVPGHVAGQQPVTGHGRVRSDVEVRQRRPFVTAATAV